MGLSLSFERKTITVDVRSPDARVSSKTGGHVSAMLPLGKNAWIFCMRAEDWISFRIENGSAFE
jgi:hypothetical protein